MKMLLFALLFSLMGVAIGSVLPGRIVGGEVVQIEQFPYQCSLDVDGFLCGASVLDETHLLTAAHCVADIDPPDPTKVNARCGSNSFLAGGQTIVAKQYTYPEDYSVAVPFDLDVAVIELSSPLTFGSTIAPIRLTNVEPPVGTSVTVSGWGRTTEGGDISEVLRAVNLSIVSREYCNKVYGGAITGNMICAAENGKDSCQGDSGGPLVSQGVQVGIVSFGEGCAREYTPGVYTNVEEILSFVTDSLSLQKK